MSSDTATERAGSVTAYLSICAIYRDEGPYLQEWLEFHRLTGVEHFFLYDNGSTDVNRQVLSPYVEQGIVTLHDWLVYPGQGGAYMHCLRHHREGSRWIAFIDLDEFLFSPTMRPVPEILRDYEDAPAVGINRATFTMCGHKTKPPGLVLENYRTRLPTRGQNTLKSVVDPRRTIGYLSPHHFSYENDAQAVDENHIPIESIRTVERSCERLRINHYWTKSEEEARFKFAKPWAGRGQPREAPNFERIATVDERGSVPDETILMYLPDLRAAIERTNNVAVEAA
jgi:hypothetical protein